MLFVPGDSLRKIQKATTLAVDSVILDLEDGVALNQKEAARSTVAQVLTTLDFGRCERLVRVQTPEIAQAQVDIEATITGRPNGYVIPKVETAAQLLAVSHCLAEMEVEHGYPSGRIHLHAMIETARAIMHLREIATATPRLASLIFGSADYLSELGATASLEGWELFYACAKMSGDDARCVSSRRSPSPRKKTVCSPLTSPLPRTASQRRPQRRR